MKLLYARPSPFVRKVMVALHETGLTDRVECVRTQVAMDAPNAELMRDNPLSKLPTLILEDGTALFDSRVICEYLDGMHDGVKLFPADPAARFQALRWQALGDLGVDRREAVGRVENVPVAARQLRGEGQHQVAE